MKKEYTIGLLALVIMLASFWLYNFLKGRNLLSKDKIYYIEYKDVSQLGKSDPVLINGLQIGTVTGLELKEDLSTILVQIEIDRNIKIPKSSIATIITSGLTGDKAIVMEFYTPCTDDCLQSGDYINGRTAGFVESMIGIKDVKASIEGLEGGIAGILDTLSATLSNEENGNEIGAMFRSLNATSANLSRLTQLLEQTIRMNQKSISGILKNFDSVSTSISNQKEQIENTLANISEISKDLSNAGLDETVLQTRKTMKAGESSLTELEQTLLKTNTTMESLNRTLAGINSGEGSLGKLLKDEALYGHLNEASKNLEALLEDMRLHPSRYVNFSLIGRKNK